MSRKPRKTLAERNAEASSGAYRERHTKTRDRHPRQNRSTLNLEQMGIRALGAQVTEASRRKALIAFALRMRLGLSVDQISVLTGAHVRTVFTWFKQIRGVLRAADCPDGDDGLDDWIGDDLFGYVYFVQSGEDGDIKIGWTQRLPETRVASFRTGNPAQLTLVGFVRAESQDVERAVHERFASLRLRGEWFRFDQSIIDFVREFSAPRHDPVTPEEAALPVSRFRPDDMVACGRPKVIYGAEFRDAAFAIVRQCQKRDRWIVQMREESRYTEEDLAAITGLPTPLIARIISGSNLAEANN